MLSVDVPREMCILLCIIYFAYIKWHDILSPHTCYNFSGVVGRIQKSNVYAILMYGIFVHTFSTCDFYKWSVNENVNLKNDAQY